MDDDVYDALYSILTKKKSLRDWPKKGDKGLRQRVYRKLQSDNYAVKEIHDPTVGQTKKRIVEKATNCIVLKKIGYVSQLVDSAYYETKGEGAKNLSKKMSHIYRGLSRRIWIQWSSSKNLDLFFKIRRLSGQLRHQKYKKDIKWIL